VRVSPAAPAMSGHCPAMVELRSTKHVSAVVRICPESPRNLRFHIGKCLLVFAAPATIPTFRVGPKWDGSEQSDPQTLRCSREGEKAAAGSVRGGLYSTVNAKRLAVVAVYVDAATPTLHLWRS